MISGPARRIRLTLAAWLPLLILSATAVLGVGLDMTGFTVGGDAPEAVQCGRALTDSAPPVANPVAAAFAERCEAALDRQRRLLHRVSWAAGGALAAPWLVCAAYELRARRRRTA